MTIQTYWDMSEAERSALTEDAMEALSKVELMTKGVLDPGELALEAEPTFDAITKRWHVVGDIAFDSEEDAAAFVRLRPRKVDSDWATGYDLQFVGSPGSAAADGVRVKELPDRSEVLERGREYYTRRKIVRESNQKKASDHEKACKVRSEALSAMWEDWRALRAEAFEAKATLATFRDYVELAKGDAEAAARFLRRAVGAERISAAQRLLGESFPGLDADGNPLPAAGDESALEPGKVEGKEPVDDVAF